MKPDEQFSMGSCGALVRAKQACPGMRLPGQGQRPLCSARHGNTAGGGDGRDAATGGALATRGPERLQFAKWKDR